ncbi:hypothetical protein JDV02_007889 [Purpureocillium takamizusanense]|nr:uncharacterized protein JDV02_007889 [Purpureocillium takamizusanense]UNI21951.1 hypothetical protein JDV02_007889 [Purpureocillium takamizusanense]
MTTPLRGNRTHTTTSSSTQPSNATLTISTSRSHNRTTTRPRGPVVSITIDCPATVNPSDCTGRGYLTVNYTRSDPAPTKKCTPISAGSRPLTEFSVVYTSTVTFYGNRSDYTPPYEPIRTPKYCTPTIVPAVPPAFSVSPKILPPGTEVSSHGNDQAHPSTFPDLITFITTDKNPSVVYPSDPVPNYSPTWGQVGDGGPGDGSHKTVGRGGNGGGDPHKTPDADSITATPHPTFKITAGSTQVVINEKTFAGLGPDQTSLVTVDGGTFTIYPNAVVGEGATVRKPPAPGTAVSVPTPTAAVVGGLPVTLSGSQAIVGGATMTIPETASTTVIDGHSISIGPGSLVVGGQSLSFKHVMLPRETDVVVSGGELLTAIGRSVVVVHSTTFTYGPGIPGTSQIIHDDTISIGPSGVIVHGTLIGGQSASPTTTSYEIVGGASITRIAPSLAVINGKTFTVGPGTEWTTTVIAGQTWTIGPTGVVGASMTFRYPFGTAVTTTISPTGTWLSDFPIETAGQNRGEDDNSGRSLRPNSLAGWTVFCIAIGVWVLA